MGKKVKIKIRPPNISYPGSLRQNNFGEGVDKGYLIWEIEDKDKFEVERVILEQKRYFFTLYGESADDVRDVGDLAEGCRIRFMLTKDVDITEELKIKSEIEKLYNPMNEVVVHPPATSVNVGSIKVGDVNVLHENIREPEVQKELIKEYYKDKNISKEDLQKVRNLDKVYHSHVETDVERNVTYDINWMKWKNLFSYGSSNVINFSKTKGLIGLFGENASGKSSVMDTLCLGVTNQVYKEGVAKNLDFINKKMKKATLEINCSMNNKSYQIEKSFEKRTGKGGDVCLAETEFYEIASPKNISLNGEKKPDTNNNIRKRFGTSEDLEATSLCPQFKLNSFIDARGTKRKEILAKYFDLDVFSTKFRIAKEDYDELKIKLKEYDYSKIQSEIESKTLELESIRTVLNTDASKKLKLIEELEKQETALKGLYLSTKNIEYDHQDLLDVELNKVDIENEIRSIDCDIEITLEQYRDFSDVGCTLEEFKKQEETNKLETAAIELRLNLLKQEKKNSLKTSQLLKQIPNVPSCRVCSLAQHAFGANNKLPDLDISYDDETHKLNELKRDNEEKNYAQIVDLWEISDRAREGLILQNVKLLTSNKELEKIREKIKIISSNIDEILVNKQIKEEIDSKENLVKEIKRDISALDGAIIELSSRSSVLDFKIKEYKDKFVVCENLNKERYIFDLYLDAMGKDGISYWIISKKMPIINNQVNFILSQAVSFKLFIEDNEEEKSVKIYIVDEKGKRPIELGSGMEKTISAIALRAALWNICLLPKTPILILDEAFANLDAEHYDTVIKLLAYLKTFFDSIFVITHDEGLKAVMDHSFYISKNSKGSAECKIK